MEEITEGDEEGGKGQFWGGGDRQSHRGSARSLTGWGSSPRPQGKGMLSDSTTCHPLTTLPPLSMPLGSPHPPLSPAHTAAPQALACSFARLLTSPPSLGYNFAQTCPLTVLHTSPSLPACEAPSALQLMLFPWHAMRLFPHAPHPLLSQTLACTRFLRGALPSTPHSRKISGPLLQTHLGHPFPHPLTDCAPLPTLSPPFSSSTFPSYSCNPAFSPYSPLPHRGTDAPPCPSPSPTVACTRASQEPPGTESLASAHASPHCQAPDSLAPFFPKSLSLSIVNSWVNLLACSLLRTHPPQHVPPLLSRSFLLFLEQCSCLPWPCWHTHS